MRTAICIALLLVASPWASPLVLPAEAPVSGLLPTGAPTSPSQALADVAGMRGVHLEAAPCPGLHDTWSATTQRLGLATPVPVLPEDLDRPVACLLDGLLRSSSAFEASGIDAASVMQAAATDTVHRLPLPESDVALQTAWLLASRVEAALPVLQAARMTDTLDAPPLLLIDGAGDSYHESNYLLTLELAGNDVYDNHAGGILASIHLGLGQATDAPGGIRQDLLGLGEVRVGDDVRDADMVLSSSLVIDVAGNDQYGVSKPPMFRDVGCTEEPVPPLVGAQGGAVIGVAMLWDLAGDDVYQARTMSQGVGHLGGVGVLYDAQGTDHFQAVRSAQGQALLGGVGLLLQGGGDTTYTNQVPAGGVFNGDLLICDELARYTQGAVFDRRVGGGPPSVGMLVDQGGSDIYRAGVLAQGFGQGPGAGLLWDLEGDDDYLAHEKAQGAAQGRSKDFNPQAPWSSGMGILLDDAGEDRYEVQRQGHGWALAGDVTMPPTDPVAAIAWALDRNEALGLLRDGGGEDTYVGTDRADGGQAVEGLLGVFLDQ